MKERGIIVTPSVKVTGSGSFYIESSEISAEQLRFALLFWDKIDWPDSNLISLGTGETNDLVFLKECGIFNRTVVQFKDFSGSGGIVLLRMQDEVLKQKNKQEPGLWSIQRINYDLVPIDGVTIQKKAIEFELYNALPIPHREVSFNDILEFKEKHRDELTAFRIQMDEMYQKILNSPDVLLAKNTAIERLSRVITDIHKAMESRSIARSLLSYKVVFNDFSDIWDAMTRGLGVYELTKGALGDELATVIGVANAVFKISAKESPMTSGLPQELKDYAYLARIEKELI